MSIRNLAIALSLGATSSLWAASPAENYLEITFPQNAKYSCPAYQKDQITYCMKLDSSNNLGGNSYALFLGQRQGPFNDEGPYTSFAGIARLVRFDASGHPILEGETETGFAGSLPRQWEWLQLGPNSWGVKSTENFFANSQVYNLLFDHNFEMIKTRLPAAYSRGNRGKLTATLKVRSDEETTYNTDGLYSIELLVNGHVMEDVIDSTGYNKIGETRRNYKDESFTWNFDASSGNYREPEDFPFNSEDEEMGFRFEDRGCMADVCATAEERAAFLGE